MGKRDEKRRRRELARREAANRSASAQETRPVNARLRELLGTAWAEIKAHDGEPVTDPSHMAELLYLEPGVDLRWVPVEHGYRFRYADDSGTVWTFRLAESQVHEASEGTLAAVAMAREDRSLRLP